jgi:cyanophycin synthetase
MLAIKSAKKFSGYWPGFKQPSLLINLEVSCSIDPENTFLRWMALIKRFSPNYKFPTSSKIDLNFLLASLVEITDLILKISNIPIFQQSKIFSSLSIQDEKKLIVYARIPALDGSYQASLLSFKWALKLMNESILIESSDKTIYDLKKLIEEIKKFSPPGKNQNRLLNAANELNIPWIFISQRTYQFGWGSKSKWFDSSITEDTSSIALSIAKNKFRCSALLRTFGVPVPDHDVTSKLEEAYKIANRLGYPVVIKPIDQDRGEGVRANIRNDETLAKAFNNAKKLSKIIIIEKHVEGFDYRLQVLDNEVYWATCRTPGGVYGDGNATIEDLVNQLNQSRINHTHLKTLHLDEEAHELLVEQNLTLQTIPKKNVFVRLRSTSNVDRGGYRTSALEGAHSDNINLAITAAKSLRLNIAGVDMIMPDIKKSWLETGAYICEVNGQPMIGAEAIKGFIADIMKDSGRIPVIIIMGSMQDTWLKKISHQIPNIAFVSSTSSIINGEKLSASPKNYLTKGKQVLMMKEVEGAVFQICNLRDIQQGLPFDNSHSIIILETYAKNHKAPNENLVWQKFCSLNINLCKNLIYYEEGYEIDKTYINSEKFKKIESLSEKSLTKLLLEILKETQNAK